MPLISLHFDKILFSPQVHISENQFAIKGYAHVLSSKNGNRIKMKSLSVTSASGDKFLLILELELKFYNGVEEILPNLGGF